MSRGWTAVQWRAMSPREMVFDEFAGDLEYHPRRAVIYFALAAAAFSFWFFSSPENKSTITPIVLGLGSLTLSLALKGVFPLRKSSEGLGLARHELDALSRPTKCKKLSELPEQAAQIVQDFGAGSMLLWPLLRLGRDLDAAWSDLPRWPIVLCGAALFGLGWLIRHLTRVRAN